MAKKKNRKKVADRLARKRGKRTAESRLKRKRMPKTSRKETGLGEEERRVAEIALMRSPMILSSPDFSGVELDRSKMTEYLEEVKTKNLEDSREFLSAGLKRLVDSQMLEEIRAKLANHVEAQKDENPESALCASVVLSLAERLTDLSGIPFFMALFIRDVKNHPLADDPVIWKLLTPFLPSRIVKPEEEKGAEEDAGFAKSEKYPHIVLPKGSVEEKVE
jgi:hypothetical protein